MTTEDRSVVTEKWSATTRRCQMCGQAMGPRMHRQPHPTNGKQVCNGCAKLNVPEWAMTYEGKETVMTPDKVAAMHKEAHDSGDGMALAHCPFCGSGGIVGSPDGTVTCQFCFAGETEFLTWDGVRTLKETVGTTQRVLVSKRKLVQTGKGRSRLGQPILTEDAVVSIRDLYAVGMTKAELGRQFNVVQGTIKKIVERRSWQHVGGGGAQAGTRVTSEAIWGEKHGAFGGCWVDAEIQSFGVQSLMEVTLSRHGVIKKIYATPEHRWFTHPHFGGAFKYKQRQVQLTSELAPGDRLVSLFTHDRIRTNKETVPSPFGVAHGFTFGDGSLDSRDGSVVTLWGDKDKALLPYFPVSEKQPVQNANGTDGISVKYLPAFFKDFPPKGESISYLYGWLAGYFAADGTVGEGGGVGLYCVDKEVLLVVRDYCTRMGIATYGISPSSRIGLGQSEPHDMFRLAFIAQTLTPEFFIIPAHRQRFEQMKPDRQPSGWTVISVEETDRVEEVFCAVVPGHENFTLMDNINVMNCKKHFTVQVQPEFKAMPQTIDGQPYNIPGMPGGGPDAGAAPDQQQEDIEQAQQDAPPPGADDGTDDGTDANDHDDDGASDGGFPFKKKKPKPEDDDKPIHQLPPHRMSSSLHPAQQALLITKEGIALPPDAYLQHLALTYADDRDQVLAQVKAENSR